MELLEAELKAHRQKSNYDYNEDLFTKSILSKESMNHPEIGEEAPKFTLKNEKGEAVSLDQMLQIGPVIITFFKGEWCNFCDLELKAMQRALPEFEKHGATVVAISPHTVTISQALKEKKQLDYSVLSDEGNRIAEKYGLRFPVQPDLMNLFGAFGLDNLTQIHGDQGEETNTLPIPGTFVVDTNGKIIFVFVDTDHTKRAEPSDIVACLMSVA